MRDMQGHDSHDLDRKYETTPWLLIAPLHGCKDIEQVSPYLRMGPTNWTPRPDARFLDAKGFREFLRHLENHRSRPAWRAGPVRGLIVPASMPMTYSFLTGGGTFSASLGILPAIGRAIPLRVAAAPVWSPCKPSCPEMSLRDRAEQKDDGFGQRLGFARHRLHDDMSPDNRKSLPQTACQSTSPDDPNLPVSATNNVANYGSRLGVYGDR